ncbi:unnamed protein product [Sphagnum jensenii]|uniref:Uncharacterized protein n=1 Tax=Sphagnum jensenii TaxID=128206 RepID=A0ABP0VWQ8_9BRYO
MHPASSGFTLHLSRSTQLTVGREVLTKTAASFAFVRQVFHFADPQGRTHARRDGDEDADSRDFSAAKTGGLVLCRSPPPDLFLARYHNSPGSFRFCLGKEGDVCVATASVTQSGSFVAASITGVRTLVSGLGVVHCIAVRPLSGSCKLFSFYQASLPCSGCNSDPSTGSSGLSDRATSYRLCVCCIRTCGIGDIVSKKGAGVRGRGLDRGNCLRRHFKKRCRFLSTLSTRVSRRYLAAEFSPREEEAK